MSLFAISHLKAWKSVAKIISGAQKRECDVCGCLNRMLKDSIWMKMKRVNIRYRHKKFCTNLQNLISLIRVSVISYTSCITWTSAFSHYWVIGTEHHLSICRQAKNAFCQKNILNWRWNILVFSNNNNNKPETEKIINPTKIVFMSKCLRIISNEKNATNKSLIAVSKKALSSVTKAWKLA